MSYSVFSLWGCKLLVCEDVGYLVYELPRLRTNKLYRTQTSKVKSLQPR